MKPSPSRCVSRVCVDRKSYRKTFPYYHSRCHILWSYPYITGEVRSDCLARTRQPAAAPLKRMDERRPSSTTLGARVTEPRRDACSIYGHVTQPCHPIGGEPANKREVRLAIVSWN
ncbi:hypothetical protein J6590_007024 [Homalodisca vitripennis]|nr:hypothetical protein J6590_007024 [Homalodisca vitripennis]